MITENMMYDISYKVKAKEVPKGQIDCLCITADGSKYEYEFLPDYVHYDIGHWKEYSGSEARRKRLSLASNIWQVGWYLPPYKFGRPENYDLTNHILKNKETDEYAFLLALSMYVKAKDHRYNFDIFDADVIVPVPNFDLNNNSRAVSISKKLANIMKIIGGQTIIQQNLLKKTKDIEEKMMSLHEKEELYSKNKLYEFREDRAGMGYLRGKKVILVDDVVTQGFAAGQCLEELSNQGAENLCFYSVTTTKMRTRYGNQ